MSQPLFISYYGVCFKSTNYVTLFSTIQLHSFLHFCFSASVYGVDAFAIFLVHIPDLLLSQQKVAEQPKRTASMGVMRFFKEIMLATLGRSASRELEERRWGLEATQCCEGTVDAPLYHVHLDCHPNIVLGKCATFRLRKRGVNVEGFVRSQPRFLGF